MKYSLLFFFISYTFASFLDGFLSDNKPLKFRYCTKDKVRNTYVLLNAKVDKNSVINKLKKLPFSPHEKLEIYIFNGKTYKLIFSACMPILSIKT